MAFVAPCDASDPGPGPATAPPVARRGRGASINPLNRLERLHVEPDPDFPPEDRPSSQTRFYLDATESLLTGNDSPDVGFTYGLNAWARNRSSSRPTTFGARAARSCSCCSRGWGRRPPAGTLLHGRRSAACLRAAPRFHRTMSPIRVIGFDADDTLWHNETIFERVHERYRALLAGYHDAATVDRTLLATERRNLELYGYGIKGFTLSSIETAIELTQGRISAEEIRTVIELGREMLAHPVELLDGARETVAALSGSHELWLVTKGDLRDQERKLAKSGLASYFGHVEILSEKNEATYAALLRRRYVGAAGFMMVGNSLKSDVVPVLAIGGSAVHVPYHLLWPLERSEAVPVAPGRFFQVDSIGQLPGLLDAASAP